MTRIVKPVMNKRDGGWDRDRDWDRHDWKSRDWHRRSWHHRDDKCWDWCK
jgi:hypothetical protein